jgi:hypothetical protein
MNNTQPLLETVRGPQRSCNINLVHGRHGLAGLQLTDKQTAFGNPGQKTPLGKCRLRRENIIEIGHKNMAHKRRGNSDISFSTGSKHDNGPAIRHST